MFFLTNIKFIPECYYGYFNTNRNTKKKKDNIIHKKNFFLVSNYLIKKSLKILYN